MTQHGTQLLSFATNVLLIEGYVTLNNSIGLLHHKWPLLVFLVDAQEEKALDKV